MGNIRRYTKYINEAEDNKVFGYSYHDIISNRRLLYSTQPETKRRLVHALDILESALEVIQGYEDGKDRLLSRLLRTRSVLTT